MFKVLKKTFQYNYFSKRLLSSTAFNVTFFVSFFHSVKVMLEACYALAGTHVRRITLPNCHSFCDFIS